MQFVLLSVVTNSNPIQGACSQFTNRVHSQTSKHTCRSPEDGIVEAGVGAMSPHTHAFRR
jgi:hypothetical protein